MDKNIPMYVNAEIRQQIMGEYKSDLGKLVFEKLMFSCPSFDQVGYTTLNKFRVTFNDQDLIFTQFIDIAEASFMAIRDTLKAIEEDKQ